MSNNQQAESLENCEDELLNVEKDEIKISDDHLVTLDDFIQIDRDAEELLGGLNDNTCTYVEGYKYRQPIYSCLTCAEKTGKQAGICFACSSHCHEGHNMAELYTKRKFCCDCGNSKFQSKCKLFEEKNIVNALNSYNHNFNQLYCSCNKIYPPENDEDNETMAQCCICEDWFHDSHIFDSSIAKEDLEKSSVESQFDENMELICKECVTRIPFIMHYENSENLEKIMDPLENNDMENKKESSCKLETLKDSSTERKPHSIYIAGLREKLCRCEKCLIMYEDNDISFLIDPEDTMQYYDTEREKNMALMGETSFKNGGTVAKTMYEIVEKKTNNREAALRAYIAVNEMSKHVGQFFKNMGDKIITPEDIGNCFEELKAKRPRLDASMENEKSLDAWTQ